MSEQHLGDDPSRWPANPYELLGIGPGSPRADVRRAYTRLIRVYKPEHYPEHFRRIREAYEAVLRDADVWDSVGPPHGSAQAGERVVPSPSSETRINATPAQTGEDDLDACWERALGGEVAAAYDALIGLHVQNPTRVEVCIRLYWLLYLFPEQDPKRAPREWLVSALWETGLTGPAHELYRREVEVDPEEALSDRCTRLLQCAAKPALLAEFARWRARAAARLGKWSVIGRDLERLRSVLSFEDEEAWIHLLLGAADELAWATEAEPRLRLEHCAQEIDRLIGSRHLDFARLDRFDLLLELSGSWADLQGRSGLVGELIQLIPRLWNRPDAETRQPLFAFLGHILRDPVEAMEDFDTVQRPRFAVLSYLGALLRNATPTTWMTPETSRLVTRFLEQCAWPDYRAFRKELLEFCLAESLDPAAVADASPMISRLRDSADDFDKRVTGDWPLRCVCLAYRVFWAQA